MQSLILITWKTTYTNILYTQISQDQLKNIINTKTLNLQLKIKKYQHGKLVKCQKFKIERKNVDKSEELIAQVRNM